MRIKMNKNLILAVLILTILLNGWAIAFLALPFYQAALIIGGVTIFTMTIVHERYVFLCAIVAALSYGAFLTAASFAYQQPATVQLLYAYSHLLLTSLLILYWVLMNFIKKIGYENSQLSQQVQLLQKYRGVTHVLTLTEFEEQAKWLLNSSKRNKEEAWFVEMDISYSNSRVKVVLQEDLERIALQTIRQKFDLITSRNGVIYLLLKNTHADGVQQVLTRFHENVQGEFNFIEPPFSYVNIQIDNPDHLASLVGLK